MQKIGRCLAAGLFAALATGAQASPPPYQLVDLGPLSATADSQAYGISPNGQYAVGRSLAPGYYAPITAVSWTLGGAPMALSSPTNWAAAYAVNDAGVAVGSSFAGYFPTAGVPMVWNNGVGTQLSTPGGYSGGSAYGINAGGTIVGYVGGGSHQIAAMWNSAGVVTPITATTSNGSFMTTAYGITDSGLVVGQGIDPTNAAISVGLVYDSAHQQLIRLAPLPGDNSTLPFGISSNGLYVTGTSGLYAGDTLVRWSLNGPTEIPMPAGASTAVARGVNSSGWVVGYGGGQYSIPFLYDGNQTYEIASLAPGGTGWDFGTNTSSSALAITDVGVIIGTAIAANGHVHGYALVPVPEPGSWALMLAGLAITLPLLRRRTRAGVTGGR